jgi:hypothetical protein
MASYRFISRLSLLSLLCMLIALAGCTQPNNTAAPLSDAPTPTATTAVSPTPTATAATAFTCTPPIGGDGYSKDYLTVLPSDDHSGVSAYDIPLPPQTRYLNDSASGHRHDYLCSTGTTDAVMTFMTQHLTQLGWQREAASAAQHCEVVASYGQPQCWKNGKYELFMGINSNADWVLAFIDPAFLM